LDKKLKIIFGLVIFCALLFSAVAPIFVQATSIQHGGTLKLAFTATIDNFSQFLTSSYVSWYFNQMAYPNLGIPLPGSVLHVAESGYSSTPNASIWFFTIRPGMHWSDGVPINATDLWFSLKLMFSTYKWGAGSLSLYAPYLLNGVNNSIIIDNASTVQVNLNESLGTLGDVIGTENTPNLTPYHIFKNDFNNSLAPGNNFGTLVSAGAFNVTYNQGDSVVVMKPNPYGSPFGGDANGVPYLNEIDVLLETSTSNLAFLLAGGSIDAAPLAPSDAVGLANTNHAIKIVSGPSPDTWNLEFPIWNYPYNETAFRQALAYSINRTDLVQSALAGYGVPGNEGYLPPSSDPSFNSSVPEYSFNVTAADALLTSDLGWTKGSNGFYQFGNGTAFTPKLYVPSENTELVTAGERIVADLQNAGIDATLQPISTTSIGTIWAQGINMYVHEQNYGYPSDELLYDFSFDGYGTAGPLTGPVFVPTNVEAAYNASLAALNANGSVAGREQIEQHLQGMIADYLPSVTLFYVNSLWAVNTANFGGWPTSPSTMDWPGGEFNQTALASIYSLAAQSTSTTTTTSSVTTSSGQSSSGTSTSTTVLTTTTSTTSTAASTNYALIGAVVVVIIVIAAVAAFALRRRT